MQCFTSDAPIFLNFRTVSTFEAKNVEWNYIIEVHMFVRSYKTVLLSDETYIVKQTI